MRGALLVLESLLFTVLVPGSVTFWLPAYVVAPGEFRWPAPSGPVVVAGAVLAALGLAIYLWCLWNFAVTGRGIPAPIDHPKRLVVRGLYRYVRNPMYLGVLLILLGEDLAFRSWRLLAYTAAWFAIWHITILVYEEPNLERKFGDSYRRYRAAVNRWIPGSRYQGEPG